MGSLIPLFHALNDLNVFLAGLEPSVDKVVAQVVFAYDGVGRNFLGQSLEENFTLEEKVGPVGDGEGFLHVVVSDKDADVAVFQSPSQLRTFSTSSGD